MEERPGEVVLTQRGRRYALGRGEGFYGIWAASPSGPVLVDRFPPGSDGWYRAWRRFNELERLPGEPSGGPPLAVAGTSSVLVGSVLPERVPPLSRPVLGDLLSASGLLLAGVLLGVVGLFFDYLGPPSLASEGYQLLAHLLYLAGWAAAGGLLLLAGRRWAPSGAALGAGVSALTFGLYLSDLGTALSGPPGPATAAGPGLYLTLIGWLACAAGSVLAVVRLRGVGRLGDPRPRPALLVLLGTGVAVLTAVTFALPWDRFSLLAAATGQGETVTAGNAFSDPGLVVAANVIVMVLTVVLVFLALSWRPPLLGRALLAGILLPLVAQLLSAVLQVATPPTAASFGIPADIVSQDRVQVTSGLTAWFWCYCACVGLLLLAGAWSALASAWTGDGGTPQAR